MPDTCGITGGKALQHCKSQRRAYGLKIIPDDKLTSEQGALIDKLMTFRTENDTAPFCGISKDIHPTKNASQATMYDCTGPRQNAVGRALPTQGRRWGLIPLVRGEHDMEATMLNFGKNVTANAHPLKIMSDAHDKLLRAGNRQTELLEAQIMARAGSQQWNAYFGKGQHQDTDKSFRVFFQVTSKHLNAAEKAACLVDPFKRGNIGFVFAKVLLPSGTNRMTTYALQRVFINPPYRGTKTYAFQNDRDRGKKATVRGGRVLLSKAHVAYGDFDDASPTIPMETHWKKVGGRGASSQYAAPPDGQYDILAVESNYNRQYVKLKVNDAEYLFTNILAARHVHQHVAAWMLNVVLDEMLTNSPTGPVKVEVDPKQPCGRMKTGDKESHKLETMYAACGFKFYDDGKEVTNALGHMSIKKEYTASKMLR